jgi:hypothetical protein
MPAAKFARDIISKLLVSLLSAPIVWAITIYYSKSISEMVSSFDPRWYRHYWYLVLSAVVLGVLQFVILWSWKHTPRNVITALLILVGLIGVYAWKQLAGRDFPLHLPLWVFFFLYCLLVAQLVSISLFSMIKITMKILAAADASKST